VQIPPAVALAFLVLIGLPGGAMASQTSAVTVVPAPVGQGEIHSPAIRVVADLRQPYVEEEYFVSGVATIYTYNETPVRGEIIVQPINPTFPQTVDVPYTTRIIVRRPVEAADFSGTLVIEWWNSTAGFDTAPAWDPAAEFIAREGWVYVGVTNSIDTIKFLRDDQCLLMGAIAIADCQTRYADLVLPHNGMAFEMVSQIANLLKNSADPQNPLPPGFEVERLYHVGQSQQGGSMVTYASAFHFPVNDGYFVQGASTARRINYGPVCGADGSPAYPDCTPALSGDDRLVATDLEVPVIRGMTETEVGGVLANGLRQADTQTFRYYEIAGATHVTVHKGVEVIPGVILLEDFCLNEMNTFADGPVLGSLVQQAMWKNLDEFVKNGTPMPHGTLIEDDAGVIRRDAYGNALGGIRTPDMEVPIARYDPNNTFDPTLPSFIHDIAQLACYLSGSVFPFDEATIDSLYADHTDYVNQVSAAADALVAEGFLLPEGRDFFVVRAFLSGVQCGIGCELVLVLPPILWLHARRRRARNRAPEV
jgi:hypothetical protein